VCRPSPSLFDSSEVAMTSKHAQAILAAPVPDEIVNQIAGDVSRQVKEAPLKWLAIFRATKGSFANSIAQRVKVVEVSVRNNPDDPLMKEGRVVAEIDVTEGKSRTTQRLANCHPTIVFNDGPEKFP
jgi:hypothetical protein